MHILMVTDLYKPVTGGLERHVETLSRELRARGHSVAVATLWHEGSPTYEEDDGVRIYRLSGWNQALQRFYQDKERHYHLTMPDPGVMASLRRVIAAEQPDIVHARGWILYSVAALKARNELNGAKLIVTLHDYSLVCPKKTFHDGTNLCTGPGVVKCLHCASSQYGNLKVAPVVMGLKASKYLHRQVDKFLTVSQAVYDASISGAGNPPRPMEVVPTFIPSTVLDEARQAGRPSFLPPQDNYILFVGQLSNHKGLPTLLKAYESLRIDVPLVLLGTVHGDTPHEYPTGVVVVENVAHAKVMAAWTHCAVGVVPSIFPEPFGQVAVEAMACGKPLVVSATGGLSDLVRDGENGLLVPPGDAVALANALRTLLSDPLLRMRMGAAGRLRARQFMVDVVADRIEAIYAEVLGAPVAAPVPALVVR